MAKRKTSRTPKPGNTKKNGVRKHRGEPFPMRLRGNLFLEYRAAAAEFGQVRAQAERCATLIAAEREKAIHQPLLRLLTDHQGYLEELRDRKAELLGVQAKVAAKLGITADQIGDYIINTDNGVVTWDAGPSSVADKPEEK